MYSTTLLLSLIAPTFFGGEPENSATGAGPSRNSDALIACDQEDPSGLCLASTFSWPGSYSMPSGLCIGPFSLEMETTCSKEFRDQLTIQTDGDGYLVDLHSTQAYQHVCAFSFRMTEANGELFHATRFGPIRVRRVGGMLRVSSDGIDPSALGLGVCGVHADIDGLEFPEAKRVDLAPISQATD